MLGRHYGIAQRPIASLPSGESQAVPNPVRALLADPAADLIYLFFADPVNESGTPTEVRLSCRPSGSRGGYVTKPADSPANLRFLPRLITPYRFTTQLPIPGTGEALGRLTLGRIVIDNADHALDDLLALSWEGREITVKIGGVHDVGLPGETEIAFADFAVLFKGTVERVVADTNEIVLLLRDPFAKFGVPIQDDTYAGTGTDGPTELFEGDESVKGLPKPLTFGRCENIAPVLIDPALLIYQFHERDAQAIEEVRDKGVALTPYDIGQGPDVGDWWPPTAPPATLFATWTPVPGQYITYRERGMIRLGSKPEDGQITADVEGDATGSYPDKVRTIVRRIAVDFGGLTDPDEIDASAFANCQCHTGKAGFYTGTQSYTVAQVIESLLRGSDHWASFTREGLFRIGRFLDPDANVSVETIEATDTTLITSQGAEPLPLKRVRVGYRRMHTVQAQEALAGSVSEADRALYGKEFRFASKEASVPHVLARELELGSPYDTLADAETDAQNLLDRGKVRRRLFVLTWKGLLYQRRAGDVVQFVASEQGLSAGKKVWVQALTEDALARETIFAGWG